SMHSTCVSAPAAQYPTSACSDRRRGVMRCSPNSAPTPPRCVRACMHRSGSTSAAADPRRSRWRSSPNCSSSSRRATMPEALPAHGAIVLAAGASGRFGRAKQLLQFEGEALVHRASRLALATAPSDVLVVVGADADTVFASVRDLAVRRVDCADWRDGMSASLRAGVVALRPECAGALIILCDQPALDAAHLE